MPTGRLILLLLLIVLAAVAIVLLLRRGAAQRDEQRVEAAGIRGEAEGIAATMTGQDTFAQQAEERAEVARLQAEQRARKAARLEAEAAEQRAAAEATRREYEATMRRADDIDPDVKESAFAPVPEPTATTDTDATPDGGDVAPDARAAATSDLPPDVAPDAGERRSAVPCGAPRGARGRRGWVVGDRTLWAGCRRGRCGRRRSRRRVELGPPRRGDHPRERADRVGRRLPRRGAGR